MTTRRSLRLLAVVMLLLSCAPSYHRAQRYRFHPRYADAAVATADDACRSRGYPAGEPTRPFVTDGCSLWPDGAWQDCCVRHDMDYWCGGSTEERRESDRALQQCVAQSFSDWRGGALGGMMRAGVVVGGVGWLPTYWRWGYGHEFPKGTARP